MNTLHRSVFYTEASDQTQAKPWKTAAECTQAPPSLRQASQQSPASCAPPPRWVRSGLAQEPWARRLHLTVTFYIFHKQKAQLHVLTVWKAHSDRLPEALLSPEEALAGARFFVGTVVRKCAAWCCGVGERGRGLLTALLAPRTGPSAWTLAPGAALTPPGTVPTQPVSTLEW